MENFLLGQIPKFPNAIRAEIEIYLLDFASYGDCDLIIPLISFSHSTIIDKTMSGEEMANISVIAVMNSVEPFNFIGRYVIEAGSTLTDTLLEQYKTKFDSMEKYLEFLLKYHWYKLANKEFDAIPVQVNDTTDEILKGNQPIFIGEKAYVHLFGKDIEEVTIEHLALDYVDTLYIFNLSNQKLDVYKPNKNNTWKKFQSFKLETATK